MAIIKSLQQGFVDESVIVKTVDDALNANDDTPVRLDGQIVNKLVKRISYLKTQVEKKSKLKSAKKAWNGQTISTSR